jgi:proline dehydrogenase
VVDVTDGFAIRHARATAARAQEAGSYLWVDMEQSHYVDATLAIVEQLKREFPAIGVCLQAYLHRTRDDLTQMLSLGAGVRLVKGAYREPPSVAIPRKVDVDANYLVLGKMMIDARAHASPSRAVFGTHDPRLIAALCSHARATGVKPGGYEFHMLYGIQESEQRRLAAAGERVRVLIAYGSYWFPWYMRRLAERPANLWFVAKNIVR